MAGFVMADGPQPGDLRVGHSPWSAGTDWARSVREDQGAFGRLIRGFAAAVAARASMMRGQASNALSIAMPAGLRRRLRLRDRRAVDVLGHLVDLS